MASSPEDHERFLHYAAGGHVDGVLLISLHGKDELPERLPVLFGSHLDSQPTGGKFDGAYGVLAELEVSLTLNDHGI